MKISCRKSVSVDQFDWIGSCSEAAAAQGFIVILTRQCEIEMAQQVPVFRDERYARRQDHEQMIQSDVHGINAKAQGSVAQESQAVHMEPLCERSICDTLTRGTQPKQQ